MSSRPKALIYAGAAILLWSTVATAFKIALNEMDYISLVLAASGWSAAALLVIIMASGQSGRLFRLGRKGYLTSAIMALLNPVAYYLVLFRSYELLPAQIAQPLNYTWPIMLVLLSIPLLRQTPRWRDALSLGLCFVGVLLISSGGRGFSEMSFSPAGITLALLSSVLWALYWVVNRRISGDAEVRMFWTFLFALPVLILIRRLIPGEAVAWNMRTVLASGYVGLFEMGVTFVFWGLAMKHARRSADIGNLVYLSPFLSLFWIRIILGEQILGTTVAGLVIIVAGILSEKLTFRRKQSG